MKLSLSALMVCLMAAPVIGGEVPQSTLSALGLGGMAPLSDAVGMHVRGSSSSATAGGGSSLFGQLAYDDGIANQTVFASRSVSFYFAGSNAGLNAITQRSQAHFAFDNRVLPVPPTVAGPGFNGNFSVFTGTMANAQGGRSFARGQ